MQQTELLALIDNQFEELIKWRRHLHQYPELSGEESQTAAFVAEKLHSFGINDIKTGFANTHAVVALISGQGNQTVALRADLDALPIQESTAFSFASQSPHIMHACGHDAHTAVLLGAAQVLQSHRHLLKGNVKLIFQPAEERTDLPGAAHLIQAGVLKAPDVSAIFGLHVYPQLPSGVIGTRIGPMMASADIFKIIIRGEGTHAARPHEGVDTILIAAQAILALHHLVSRRVNPNASAVLSIGKIQGGHAENVLPNEVSLSGTVRTLDPYLQEKFPHWIRETLAGVCQIYGGKFELDYILGYQPVINHTETTIFAENQLKRLFGNDKIKALDYASMGGEDFGAFLYAIPGTFFRLGIRPAEETCMPPLHSPKFYIDENALKNGVAALTWLAFQWLSNNA